MILIGGNTVKWLMVGMKKEFVESFVQWMKENNVRVSESFELFGS